MKVEDYREQEIAKLDKEISKIKKRLASINGCGWDIEVGVDKYGLLRIEGVTGDDLPLKYIHGGFEPAIETGYVNVSLYLIVDRIVVSKNWVVRADWINICKVYDRRGFSLLRVEQTLSDSLPLDEFGEVKRYARVSETSSYGYKLEFYDVSNILEFWEYMNEMASD